MWLKFPYLKLRGWSALYYALKVLVLLVGHTASGQRLTLDQKPSFQILNQKGALVGHITADTLLPLLNGFFGAGFKGSASVKWSIAKADTFCTPPVFDSVIRLGHFGILGRSGQYNTLYDDHAKPVPGLDSITSYIVVNQWLQFSRRDSSVNLYNLLSKQLIAINLLELKDFGNGYFRITTPKGARLVNAWGNELLKEEVQFIDHLGADQYLVCRPGDLNCTGYSLTHGLLATRGQNLTANGKVWLLQNGFCWAILDKAGHTIEPDQDSIHIHPSGWLWTGSNQQKKWFAPNGCSLAAEGLELAHGFADKALFRHGPFWEMRDTTGTIISYGFDLAQPFDSIGYGNGTYLPSRYLGKIGAIGQEGLKRLGHRYDQVGAMTENRVPVYLQINDTKKGWGIVDQRDSLILQPIMDSIGQFCNGIAVVKKDGLYQMINADGRYLLDAWTNTLVPTSAWGWVFAKQGRLGYINNFGEVKVVPKYLEIKVVQDGVLLLKNLAGKWGLTILQQELNLEPVYDFAVAQHDGLGFAVWKNKAGTDK